MEVVDQQLVVRNTFFELVVPAPSRRIKTVPPRLITRECDDASSVHWGDEDTGVSTQKVEDLPAAIAANDADLKAATDVREKEAADVAAAEVEPVDDVDTLGRVLPASHVEQNAGSLQQAQNHTDSSKDVPVELPAQLEDSPKVDSEVAQGFPQLVVRNTFFELADPAGTGPSRRTKTEPPRTVTRECDDASSLRQGDEDIVTGVRETEAADLAAAEAELVDGVDTLGRVLPASRAQGQEGSKWSDIPFEEQNVRGIPEVLSQTSEVPSVTVSFSWTKGKVSGGDIRLVSTEFKSACGKDFPAVPFKVNLVPLKPFTSFRSTDGKGPKGSDGKGYLQLQHFPPDDGVQHKAPAANIRFRFSVGSGGSSSSCDAVAHDFSRDFKCEVTKVWDFKFAAEKSSDKCAWVTLEILPPAEGS